jgi:hypothetical protein
MRQRREGELDSMEVAHRQGWAAVAFFALLHALCCGVPLLLLSVVSFQFIVPWWPVLGTALMVLGVVGFIWYLKRGCATCPRNEGRGLPERRRRRDERSIEHQAEAHKTEP